jgi:hypothetical protein
VARIRLDVAARPRGALAGTEAGRVAGAGDEARRLAGGGDESSSHPISTSSTDAPLVSVGDFESEAIAILESRTD